jgi:hypothetical protein
MKPSKKTNLKRFCRVCVGSHRYKKFKSKKQNNILKPEKKTRHMANGWQERSGHKSKLENRKVKKTGEGKVNRSGLKRKKREARRGSNNSSVKLLQLAVSICLFFCPRFTAISLNMLC